MRARVAVLLILSFCFVSSMAGHSLAASQDQCRDKGIIVKNLTTRDLWHKGKEGPCYIWVKDHIVSIKPGDALGIFSDMTCETKYCSSTPTYRDYKATDGNGDCRVRILSDCRLSDM